MPRTRTRIRSTRRAAALALGLAALTGCEVGDLEPSPPDAALRDMAPDPPDAAPAIVPARLAVTYASTTHPFEPGDALMPLSDGALFRFAENVARVAVHPGTGQRAQHLRVERGDEVLYDAPVDGPLDTRIIVDVPLPTAGWSEGAHPLRVVATTDGDEVLTVESTVQVFFEVTAIAEDPDDPALLWLGTDRGGLLAYHLGDDLLDRADDRALVFGGHPVTARDLLPEDGRPGRDDGDGVAPSEPAGRNVLDVLPAEGGVFVSAQWRGASFLDDGGTVFDRADDGYALFHPGTTQAPGAFEASMANMVVALAADGARGLWMGTALGLVHLATGGTPFNPGGDVWSLLETRAPGEPSITALAVDPGGRVWIASIDDPSTTVWPLVVLDAGGTPGDPTDDVRAHLNPPGSFRGDITALALDGDRVYVGTSGGLLLLDHGGTPTDRTDDVWIRLGVDEGLVDADIGALAVRPDGLLWVGAFDSCRGDGGGLMLLDPAACFDGGGCAPLVLYTAADGLADDDISRLRARADGSVALSTFNRSAPKQWEVLRIVPEDACPADAQVDRATIGRGGLSIVDPGADLLDKGDDAILNL